MFNEEGCRLYLCEPEAPIVMLGLVETWRILRRAARGDGCFRVMARDLYWLGEQQATHVMKITQAEQGDDCVVLRTDEGRVFSIEPVSGADAEAVREFRRYAADPNSGYARAEEIQRKALTTFVNDLESEGR